MRKRFEKRLDAEIQFHLDAAIQAYLAEGLPPEEARRRALMDFGALELSKDEVRDLHPFHWMEEIGRDLRYAGRQLRKSPGFTVTILLTLALCIGANTAIFSIVDQVFFRALPYPDPSHLMMIARTYHKGNLSETHTSLNGFAWQLIRNQAQALESAVYIAGSVGVNLFASKHVEYIQKQQVCAGFFRLLGIPPLIGREFTRQEDVPGGPKLAVLSYAIWQRIFHRDPGILGRSIDLEGAPYTVIGVMPRDFQTDAPQTQVWTPLEPSTTGIGGGTNYEVLARLKPGATVAQANAELAAISPAVGAQTNFEPGTFSLSIVPLQAGRTMNVRSNVKLMWAAAGLILFIGCINIAGILLARSISRSREIATRLALGGSRRAIIRQLFTESLILAFSGGLLGLMLGYFVIDVLNHVSSSQFKLPQPLELNLEVLIAMAAVSLVAGVIFGFFPAFEATAMDLRTALAEAGRSSAGSFRQWKRQLLVFAEVALGVVLVISAGLLIRSLSSLLNINPGFDPNQVVTASLSLQDARYKTTADGARLFRDSLDRMRQIPGVESAGVTLTVPYQRGFLSGVTTISGRPVPQDNPTVNFVYATSGFFDALHIPVLRGRLFTDQDGANTQKVAVVNQAFVNYFPHTPNPLGDHIVVDGSHTYTIIGIIHDIPQQGWGPGYGPIAELPQMWVPAAQVPDQYFLMFHQFFSPSWIVRTRGAIPNLEQKMRQAIATVDPRLPFSAFHNIDQLRGEALGEQRYQATLFSAFAGLAILLCALGVYGLIAQSVAQRTREMGIRLALGATRQNIVSAAVLPGVKLSLAGIICGVVLSMFATRLLKSLVWGITTTDPATFITVALLLIAIAALASLIPALRLVKVDPAQTLRDE